MLIEMLIDDLMKVVRTASDANTSNAQASSRWCQKAASDDKTIRCTDEFSMMSKKLHLDDRMHWRIFDFAKRLHLTLKQSDALTDFRFCQKTASDSETIKCIDEFSILSESCIWLWNNQMHWQIDYDLAVSATDVVTRFWLMTQTNRRQTDKTNRKQTNRRQNVKNETMLADC